MAPTSYGYDLYLTNMTVPGVEQDAAGALLMDAAWWFVGKGVLRPGVRVHSRPRLGRLSESCEYQLHADLVGARNVGLGALLVRQDWASTGCL